MRRISLEEWAGFAMLLVAALISLPGLLGLIELTVPLLVWQLTFAVFAVSLLVAVWSAEGTRITRTGLAIAVASSCVLALTAPANGFVAILLVLVAAVSVYLVPLRISLGIVAINTLVLVGSGVLDGRDTTEIVLTAGLYVLIQLASVFSSATILRERHLRKAAAATQVDLQTANLLLDESARTEERLRISRDLHDMIGHQLTVLTLELEAARHKQGAAVGEHVERANTVARGLLADVRDTVGDLRSPPRDLAEAIDRVVMDVPGLDVRVAVAAPAQVSNQATTAMVRAVQEIVTNTIRHADATSLSISIEQDAAGTLRLNAADNGRGSAKPTPGNGLRGMIERFQDVGGQVALDGRHGFRVTAEVPRQ